MRVLVTGGDGFIGGEIVRQLLDKKYKVGILDCRTYASFPEQHQDYYTKLYTKVGDCVDFHTVEKVFREFKPDFVIHAAAESHVDRSILGPEVVVNTNVLGTLNILEAVRHYDTKRLVMVSTDEVYGDWAYMSLGPAKESASIQPSSPYSASKAAADLLTQTYFRTYLTPVVITRGSNTYGPWQHPEKFVPTIIAKVGKNFPIPVYGDGLQKRQWIHVSKHAEGIIFAMEKGRLGCAYNIAGTSFTNLSWISEISQYLKNDPTVTHVKDRPGHDVEYNIDSSAIEALGYSVQQGVPFLRETVQWYMVNKGIWLKKMETSSWKKYNRANYDTR